MRDISDLWDYECTILESQPQDSLTFDWLEEFAEQYKKEKEEDKKAQIKIKQIIKTEYKQYDNIWKEINSIPSIPDSGRYPMSNSIW